MAPVVNGPRTLGRLERAIEHRQMLVLNMWSAFDGSGSVDVTHDGIGLLMRVTQLEKCARNRVIDNLDHAAANQLLVLDQRQVGLDTSGVAVHHEADGSSRSENCNLAVSVTVFFSVGEGFVPARL